MMLILMILKCAVASRVATRTAFLPPFLILTFRSFPLVVFGKLLSPPTPQLKLPPTVLQKVVPVPNEKVA